MGYAIELTFDAATDERIRGLWQQLAGDGDCLLEAIGSRPHVSLAVFDGIDAKRVGAGLQALARQLAPAPVSLDAVGCFSGTSPVLFLEPRRDTWLRRARDVFDRWCASHELVPRAHYETARWMPHCTVGQALTADQLDAAWPVLHALDLPWTGRIEGIRLVSFRPVELVAHEALGHAPIEVERIDGGADGKMVEVVELYRSVFGDVTADELDDLRAELDMKNNVLTTFAARAGGQLVGFKIGYHRRQGHFHSWIGGVAHDWRRLGIAEQLMQAQHAWCRSRGYQVIRTVTLQRYGAMFQLNLRHGFEIMGTLASPRGLKLVMEKRLTLDA